MTTQDKLKQENSGKQSPKTDSSDAVACSGVLSTNPIRIQRKRIKGWKMPPNTRSVTRPGKFGNPFDTAQEFRTVLEALLSSHGSFDLGCTLEDFGHMAGIANRLDELKGSNLACFCGPEKDCHADVLLEYANR